MKRYMGMSKNTFIERANKIHGNKYDYSKTDLEHRDEKGRVVITCPIHGDFLQTPAAHLTGRKCNKCSRPSYDTESFIKCSKEKHGDKYDYSLVEYKNTKTDVKIICPIHGEFKTTPNEHLDGVGCPICANKYKGINGSLTTKEFIKIASEKFKDKKYTYEKTDLEHRDEKGKVCVTCHEKFIDGTEHGDNWVSPTVFLKNGYCAKCSGKHSYTKEEFIRISNFIHDNKYDYSKIDLEHRDEKGRVCIICPEHGEFWQTPNSHLSGKGCILCNNKMEDRFYNEFTKLFPKIKVIRQFTPSFLKNGKSHQSLDFYLPEYNIAIEYQGREHFEVVNKFGGIDNFTIQQERDKRKKDKCSENGLKIIYFTYDKKRKKFLNENVFHEVIKLEKVYG